MTELARNLVGFVGFCVHELNRQVLKLENRVQTLDIRFNFKQLLTTTSFLCINWAK